jgi:hypothetical protein
MEPNLFLRVLDFGKSNGISWLYFQPWSKIGIPVEAKPAGYENPEFRSMDAHL